MSRRFNLEDFEKKFDKVDGCWEWKATKNQDGYGRVKRMNKLESAHRVAYEVYVGPLNGLQVLHRCDNPSCVNPQHLFLGTVQDNNRDKAIKNRVYGRKLTADDVRDIRKDTRLQRIIADDYQISQQLISHIKSYRTWKHVV